MNDTMTKREILDFHNYFNVADELCDCYDPRLPRLTLDDLRPSVVTKARRSADRFGLSWPPRLAEAEEFFSEHRDEVSLADV